MNKVRIAIIDTGIFNGFTYNGVKEPLDGCRFWIEHDDIYMDEHYEDLQGHGTMVAATIKKYCPNSFLYVIKIYDQHARTSSVLLLQALYHLANIEVDYINISLAVDGEVWKEEISSALKHLDNQGKKVFVAVKNGLVTSFPASDPSCYGVRSKEEFAGTMKIQYEGSNEGKGIFLCDGSQEKVEILEGIEKEFIGNSKATAKALGIIAEKEKQKNGDCGKMR